MSEMHQHKSEGKRNKGAHMAIAESHGAGLPLPQVQIISVFKFKRSAESI